MTPGHRQWKKSILIGGALCAAWWPYPPFIWNNSTFLGLNLFILIWTTPHGLNVTSAIPPFIYSVGPGNQFMLLDPDVFFAPSSVVDSSNYHPPFLFCFDFFVFLKMGREALLSPMGARTRARKRRRRTRIRTRPSETPRITRISRPPVRVEGSAHKDQSTGNFTVDAMAACIEEIKRVEAEAAAKGEQPKLSRNKICRSYGLAPGTVSKRMTGKVTGMGPQGGGAWRGRIFTAG